jgi:hypothetical protein
MHVSVKNTLTRFNASVKNGAITAESAFLRNLCGSRK